MGRGWGRARRGAMLILMATVETPADLFVGFSDDRLVEIVVRFGVFILVLVVVVVGIPRRRQRTAHDGDAVPLDQPGRRSLGNAQGHVGLLSDVATFTQDVSARAAAR